ncbi:MAG: hypothetical protein ACOX6I_07830 [Syntrophomonadaceae bacterium]
MDWFIEKSGNIKKLRIFFFGGEPFLNFSLMKAIVEYAEKSVAKIGKKVTFHVTSNSTLLDDEKIAFMKQHQLKVMISFDGPKEVQVVKQSQHSLNILPKNFRANPIWRNIMAFADQWFAGESLCNSLTKGLWFEFDVSGPPPILPIPSIFFGVKNNSVDNSIMAIMNGLTAFNYDLPSIQFPSVNTFSVFMYYILNLNICCLRK